MFTAKQIKERLDSKPFIPFRLLMSNGKSYEVPHHDAAWVTAGTVEVGMELDKEGFAQNVARCGILHIATIEDLKAA